jgi:ubiquinone/menaquinone biosynthesis C-methylase UbiE
MKRLPLTIENRWDILYRDYPEIYDEFAAVPKDPQPLQVLADRFDFRNKVIADIGSGSGSSSFEFAKVAKKVIGVELEESMRELAERQRLVRGLHNIEFVKGDAKKIPLEDSSVEIVAGITLALYPVEKYREFANEAMRVSSNGGLIVMLNITPGWYGGELANVILDEDTTEARQNEIFVDEFGFKYEDFETDQEYGSMDRIIRTYGFIFGKRAIDYLVENKKTNIKWKFRIHYTKVQKK